MTIASDIIKGRMPDFDFYLRQGESLDDIDEYGFTPLIEAVITRQEMIAKALIARRVDVNKKDIAGRSALHWAVDNADLPMTRLLLEHGAEPNAYTPAGLSVLVYPILRGQDKFKHLLYQFGARLEFALDFIQAKLIGHRFELAGDVDIVNAKGEYIELDYEGFILEFTVAILQDSLRRYLGSFATRHMRDYFPLLQEIMDGFIHASTLLQMQHLVELTSESQHTLKNLIKAPLLILPAASRGHAMSFIRLGQWWAKIDRGENSLKEGSINFYRITQPQAFDVSFLMQFMLKKNPRPFYHQSINDILGLVPHSRLPMPSQIVGNCSWANIQATIPAALALLELEKTGTFSELPLMVYDSWISWDKDRALDDFIQRFYLAEPARKASIAAVLAAVIFQSCDYHHHPDLQRAERILPVLLEPKYYYILQSYLEAYCIRHLTPKGNNLLKILDDCGFNPKIGVSPIATHLKLSKK